MRKVNILVADDEELLRDIVEMILESEISANFIKVEDGAQGIKILNTNKEIDLIISDYSMPLKNGGDLYIENTKIKNCPFVLLSGGEISDYPSFKGFKEKNPLNRFVEKPYEQEKLVSTVKEIISKLHENNTEIVEDQTQYINPRNQDRLLKVKLDYFIKYAKSAHDVFIQLGSDKFVRIMDEKNAKESVTEILNYYKAKKIEHVFITEDKFNELVLYYKDRTINYVRPEESVKIAGALFHLSVSTLTNLGMSSGMIEKTNLALDQAIKEITKDNSLNDKFKNICENEGFIVGHSILLTHIAGNILQKTTYQFDSNIKRIGLAALVHDLALDDELAQKEVNINFVGDRVEKHKILNHPMEAVKFLQSKNELFEDTKKIVLEHHEKPDGTGFPKGLNASNTYIFSALFNLSHDLAVNLIKSNYRIESLIYYLEIHEAYYNHGAYAKFYQIAKDVFEKSKAA